VFGGPERKMQPPRLKTALALVSAVGAVSVFLLQPGWRVTNTERVQEAVLLDLLQDTRWGFSGHPNPVPGTHVVCVSLWRSRDPFVKRAEADPSAATLAKLGASGRRVVPGSTCTLSRDENILRYEAEGAVLIGAGAPEWVDDEFVRIEGAWYVGPFYAAGSRYTVSFAQGKWRVDTVAFTWVARSESVGAGRRTSG
jgi:hypothetical protein